MGSVGSTRDLIRKLLNLSKSTEEKEQQLGVEEKKESKYLGVLQNENPSQEELKKAVDEFLNETKVAKEIAENLFHLSEGELHLRQIEDKNKFSEHIREIEQNSESFDQLASNFLHMVKELEQERQKLEGILNSRGIDKSEKMSLAERRLQKTESMAQKTNENKEGGLSRREFVKAGAAIGLGAYWLNEEITSNDSKDLRRETRATLEIIEEYNDRIYQKTQERNFNLKLPIAVGERHAPPGDSFENLKRLALEHDPSKIALEFLHYESETIKKFNIGETSPEQLTEIYIERNSWQRIESQLIEFFTYLQNNQIKLQGLEYKPVSTGEERRENYSDQLERSEAMVEIAKEINDGKTIFLAGSTHVDRRMSITTQLLKNAHPEIATRITPDEAIQDPYLYTEFENKTGVPNEESLGSEEDGKVMFSFQSQYTFAGAIQSVQPVYSTHPGSEIHRLEKSGLQYLESSNITDVKAVKKKIRKSEKIIKNMESKSPYKTVSSSGYGVFVEENPK